MEKRGALKDNAMRLRDEELGEGRGRKGAKRREEEKRREELRGRKKEER